MFTPARTLLATAVAAAALALGAPAQAAPLPLDQQVSTPEPHIANVTNGTAAASMGFRFTQNGEAPVKGTQVRMIISSCDRMVTDQTMTLDGYRLGSYVNFSEDGTAPAGPNPVNSMLGPSVHYEVQVTQPGYDTYSFSGDYRYGSALSPTCAVLLGVGPLKVSSWSKKANGSSARVGATVRVTPTRSNATAVAYQWRLNGVIVGTTRALKIKNKFAGRNLSLMIRTDLVDESRSRVIKYGIVKRK